MSSTYIWHTNKSPLQVLVKRVGSFFLTLKALEKRKSLRHSYCNIPKKCWPKVDLRCVDEGKGCGPLDAKSGDIWGVVSFSHKTLVVAPLFSPFLGRQPPFGVKVPLVILVFWLFALQHHMAQFIRCFVNLSLQLRNMKHFSLRFSTCYWTTSRFWFS